MASAKKKTKREPMDDYLKEAARLGLTYGGFQALCYELYPDCRMPMQRYFEDGRQDIGPRETQEEVERRARIARYNEACKCSAPVGGRRRTHCDMCGAPLPPDCRIDTKYCSSDCRRTMNRHQKRLDTAMRSIKWRIREGQRQESDEAEMAMIRTGLLPGLPDEKQPWIARQRREKRGGHDAKTAVPLVG